MKTSKYYYICLLLLIIVFFAEKFYANKIGEPKETGQINHAQDHLADINSAVDHQNTSSQKKITDDKKSSLAISSLPIEAAKQNLKTPGNLESQTTPPPSLDGYSAKIPKLFSAREKPNVDYFRPPGESEEHLAYFKSLSDNGDAYGKFLYANRLWYALNKKFNDEYLRNGQVINEALWRSRFGEVSTLYIESAKAGIWHAAAELPVIPDIIEHDNVEALSWSLISDKIQGQGNNMLASTCRKLKDECTDELLSQAVERATFYIDFYELKSLSKSRKVDK